MATIKDVAKLAGVGVGTASRAMSGKGAVSADAVARVQAAVQALDFRPSNVARALSLKTLGMVGVYVPEFGAPFTSRILNAIDAELRAVGRHMVVASGCGHGDARQQALEGMEFLVQRQCDGMLVFSNHLLEADLQALQLRFPRVVLLNRQSPALGERAFFADHEQGGRLAARALLSQGHRAIATIQGALDAPDNAQRMQGFYAALAQHGIDVKSAHRMDGGFSFASGHAAATRLLKRKDRSFTAVFCANDVMAMAAISRFTQAGLKVPQDVSVIGYDDTDVATYTAPPLTTVHIPIAQLAANSCRHLLNLCYGLALPVQRDFTPHVVWRESVGTGPHPAL
ncbi:MAG: substrate-binding domain-containing protein [Rhodoferax sp.]|uniref:LacI family DNA-binding transcriptional regulator n=1 Tax=Rhodoferax sp. TaxID=50421 RepID=UPI00326463E5